MDVVWEEHSRPLSVEGLTTAEAVSELSDEMSVGASMKGMPPVTKSKQSLRERLWANMLSLAPGVSCSSLHILF